MNDPKHVFVWLTFRGVPFQHHGVDMGDGTVVHFCNGEGGVAGPGGDWKNFRICRTPVERFAPNGDAFVRVVEHSKPLDAAFIRRRAERMVGRGSYDLFVNNCEHFASWCVAGHFHSRQVGVATERLASIGAKATVGIAGRVGLKSLIATSKLAASARHVASPWLLAADGVQWVTEAFGHHVGLVDPRRRSIVSRAAGGVTAAVVGLAGGPVGAVVAAGVWAAGETAAIGVEKISRR